MYNDYVACITYNADFYWKFFGTLAELKTFFNNDRAPSAPRPAFRWYSKRNAPLFGIDWTAIEETPLPAEIGF